MKGKCGQDVLTTKTCFIHQTQVACQIEAAVASLSEAGLTLFSLSIEIKLKVGNLGFFFWTWLQTYISNHISNPTSKCDILVTACFRKVKNV